MNALTTISVCLTATLDKFLKMALVLNVQMDVQMDVQTVKTVFKVLAHFANKVMTI